MDTQFSILYTSMYSPARAAIAFEKAGLLRYADAVTWIKVVIMCC